MALLLTACSSTAPVPPSASAQAVQMWEAAVVATYPHDRGAFTQGLEYHDGVLYESSGLFGESWIGTSTLEDPTPTKRVPNPAEHFAEGMTVVGDKIWQITWRNNVAVLRDRASLAPLREARYDGEGWGLCLSGNRLVMSNGTSELSFRDPATFAPLGTLQVKRDGEPVERLNELECVGSSVWANVWMTEELVRIDLATGNVTGVLHVGMLPGLVSANFQDGRLNGVAALPGTDDLLITGKNWPHMYRIRLAPR